MTEVEDIIKCTECASRNLIIDDFRGELYCYDCGVVLDEDIIETTSAGRQKPGDPQSELSHERNREGFILGSTVGYRNHDGSSNNTKIARSLRRMDKRVKLTAQERNQQRGLVLCNMLASEFETSHNFKEQVSWNYKKIQVGQVLNGMSLEIRAAAIVYYTFKDNGISRTINEVCSKNSAHPRQVAKSARKIASFFRKPWVLSQKNIAVEIEKYCSLLGVHRDYTNAAIKIGIKMHQMAEERFITANVGFTAACIYLAGRLMPHVSIRTQIEISTVCNITEVTLRNNMLNLLKMINLTRDDLEGLTVDSLLEGAYKNEE